MSRIDFGLVITARDVPVQELIDFNRRCIQELPLGFSTLWIEGHFQWSNTAALECLTSLSFFAAEFPHLNVGSLVLCQSYRNPALMAKMAANIQFLTHGRFILGIGAGWYKEEHLAYGYPFSPVIGRLEQLEETLLLTRALWSSFPANFHGTHYSIDNAYCAPLPSPPIPLLIGGGGEKRTLRLVAQYANWWNLHNCSVEEYSHKIAILQEHCSKVGRDINEITFSYLAGTVMLVAPSSFFNPRPQKMEGTPEEVIKKINEYIKIGVKHIMLKFPDIDTLQTFKRDVLPNFID